MKNILYKLICIILFVNNCFAQEDKREILINIKNCNEENFWQCYKDEVTLRIAQKLTKGATREALINLSERDTVHLKFTYWLQKNGKIYPGLFGCSFERNTPEFNELYWIVDATKLETENLPKKVILPNEGKQLFLNIDFRKIESSKGIVMLRPFKYEKKDLQPNDYKNVMLPVYPGCRKFSEMNEKNFKKSKRCMQYSITNYVSSNYDMSLLQSKYEFLRNKAVKTITDFVISKEGLIEKLKSISLVSFLENESTRILSQLPKIKPGTKDGKPVGVLYTIPIKVMCP